MSEVWSGRDSRCSFGWMRMERRATRRIELRFRDAFVRGSRLGTPHVVDLSASGMGVVLSASAASHSQPSHELHELRSESIELCLGADVCVRAVAHPVRHELLESGQVYVGLRLTELSPEDLAQLHRFLLEEAAEQEEAFDRYWSAKDALISRQSDHIARILRLGAEPGSPELMVFEGRTKLDTRLSLCALDDEGFTARLVSGANLTPGRRFGLVVSGRAAVSAFRAGLRRVEGNVLHFALPTELVQSGFRSSARVTIPVDRTCTIRFPHPRSGEWIEKDVLEASQSGVSVRLSPSRELLFPDDQLSEIELSFDTASATVQGIVRGVQDATAEGSCGIELCDFGSAEQHDRWTEFVFQLAHPRLTCDGARAPRLGYEVLESSGYVELWSGSQDRALLARDYGAYWDADTRATGRVATLLEGSLPVATMAANLLYPRTFMLHHFGVDARARRDRPAFLSYARELYSGMLHELQRFDQLEFVTMYMEADKGFNDFLYGEFARMYGEPEVLSWAKNQVYRADTRRAIPEGPMDRLVRVATEDDLVLLERSYARSLRPLQIAAHELSAQGLSADGFARKLGPHGAVRARQCYVFAPAGHAVWALVCETGNEGVNLFGLMNRCWLTELSALSSREASAARRTLLRRALRHFAEAGKRQVLLLSPVDESQSDPLGAGFERVAEGAYWLSRREVMPAWLSYVEDAFSLSRSRLRRAA